MTFYWLKIKEPSYIYSKSFTQSLWSQINMIPTRENVKWEEDKLGGITTASIRR